MSDNFENKAWINKEKTLKMTADQGKQGGPLYLQTNERHRRILG